jgi:hypothetical protein
MKCRIFRLQQRPKTHLAHRKKTHAVLPRLPVQHITDCRTALMSGSHASTVSTVGVLHHKIDTSATAYTKQSIELVMEIANLFSLVMD